MWHHESLAGKGRRNISISHTYYVQKLSLVSVPPLSYKGWLFPLSFGLPDSICARSSYGSLVAASKAALTSPRYISSMTLIR